MKKSLLIALFIFSAGIVCAQSWNWAASPTGRSFIRINAITTDPNGYTYACGIYTDTAWFGSFVLTSPGASVRYGFVAKYSPSGVCIWAKRDSLKENVFDIAIDADRNSYVIANKYAECFLTKWDSSGTMLWDSILPGNAFTNQLHVDASGNCWICGRLPAGQATFGSDVITGPCGFVAEYDANGNSLHAFSIGRQGKISPNFFAIDAAGDITIASALSGDDTIGIQPLGCEGSTILMLKYSPAGNLLWWRDAQAPAPGTADAAATGLCMDAQGNTYISSTVNTQDFMFGTDTIFMHPSGRTAAIIKFDANGNLLWLKQPAFNGVGLIYFMDMACDQDQVYFTGRTDEDFNFGSLVVTDNTNAYTRFFMIAMDFSGNALYEVHTTGFLSITIPLDICADNTGKIWVGGFHDGGPSFGPFTLPNAPSGVNYGFLVQLQKSGVGMPEIVSSHSVELFPGMETQTFALQVDEMLLQENPLFVLYDVTGRVVKTISINESRTEIDCADVAAGVYTWSVENAEERFSGGKLLNQ